MRRTTTILLLEDDKNDAFFFRRALAVCDFEGELRVAETTNKARDYLEGQGKDRDRNGDPLPDVIVTDLQENRTNAIEFLDWIRQQESCKQIPIVVFAGGALPQAAVSALENGVAAIFAKSKDFRETCERVKSILTLVPKREK